MKCKCCYLGILILIGMLLLAGMKSRIEPVYYTADMLADAIYWAEGGPNTNYPYGIRSVKCDGFKECRAICLRTIRNNQERYKDSLQRKQNSLKWENEGNYLTFLSNRYCPPSSDFEGNKNWKKNVRYFLRNPKEV